MLSREITLARFRVLCKYFIHPWQQTSNVYLQFRDVYVIDSRNLDSPWRLIGTLSSGSQDAFLLFAQMVFGLISHTRSASVHTSEKSIRLMLRDLYENISSEHEGNSNHLSTLIFMSFGIVYVHFEPQSLLVYLSLLSTRAWLKRVH